MDMIGEQSIRKMKGSQDSTITHTHTHLTQSGERPTLYSLQRDKTTTPQEEGPEYDTKMHQIVRIYFWNFGKCQVPLDCSKS